MAGDWLADPDRWAGLRRQLAETVAEPHVKRDPLAIGMPPEAARAALGLPDRALIEALAQGQHRPPGWLPAARRTTEGPPVGAFAAAAPGGRGAGRPGGHTAAHHGERVELRNWGSTREPSPPPRGPACCCG